MLDSRAVADGQSVVSWVSDTGSNEEQTIHRGLQKLLRFLTWNFNMQPSRTERKAPIYHDLLRFFYLDKLIKVPKEAFLVDGKLVVPVENSVVLHFPTMAHAQCIVPRVVAALADQKEAVFTGLQ